MQDAHDEESVATDLVDDHVRERGEHEFPSVGLLADPAAMRKLRKGFRRAIDTSHQVVGAVGSVQGQIIGNTFEVVGGPARLTERHLPLGLQLCEPFLQTGADFFVRQHVTALDLLESLFDFLKKPVLVVDRSLESFDRQRLWW